MKKWWKLEIRVIMVGTLSLSFLLSPLVGTLSLSPSFSLLFFSPLSLIFSVSPVSMFRFFLLCLFLFSLSLLSQCFSFPSLSLLILTVSPCFFSISFIAPCLSQYLKLSLLSLLPTTHPHHHHHHPTTRGKTK